MAKKYKPLTRAEKKINKEVREHLREQGILPPVKKPLNRKKFAEEVRADFRAELCTYDDAFYLQRAIVMILPSGDRYGKLTSEDVGLLKAVKLAVEMKRFEAKRRDEGQPAYTIGELYEQVYKPILDL